MKNILVTGGAGYVGSGLLQELLLKNYKVTCVDNLKFGGESLLNIWHDKNFTFINCDINDHEKLDKILLNNNFYAVIHLAAIVGDPACKLYSDLATKTNWDSSKHLIDKAMHRYQNLFLLQHVVIMEMKDPKAFVRKFQISSNFLCRIKSKIENYLLKEMKRRDGFSPTSLRFSTVYGLSPRMRFDLTVMNY